MHAARIELLKVGNDENVGFHYSIDQVVSLGGLGKANVKWRDVYAAGFECIGCLAMELTDNLLVRPCRGRWFSDIGGAIDPLVAVTVGPHEVVGVAVVVCVSRLSAVITFSSRVLSG